MRRLLPLLALAALSLPATASAAPFGELPPLPGDSSCLTATGAAGELVRGVASDLGEPRPPALLRVGPGGVTPAGTVPLTPGGVDCPVVAARPDGTAIAASVDHGALFVSSRAAGGAFGAPEQVTGDISGDVDELTAALSPRGDALVAWRESREGSKSRIRYVTRAAGQAFGAPRVLASALSDPVRLSAGMAADGGAVVAWSALDTAAYHELPVRLTVRAAFAPAGGAFGAPQTVAVIASHDSSPALAVGDDGRALLTLPDAAVLRLAERPPGGAFAAPVPLVRAPGPLATAAAVGAAGRAAVVWDDVLDGSGGLVTRAATGPFGAPARFRTGGPLLPVRRRALDLLITLLTDTTGPFDTGFAAVTLTPGATTAAWLAERKVHGVTTAGVRAATVADAGGTVERSQLGGGLHDAESLVGYPTAGGSAGVAWLESDTRRLRAALPGAVPAADAPAPALRVRRSGTTVVRFGRPLVLHVSCSAACDVRGQIGHEAADGELSLAHAGHGRLQIGPQGALIGSSRAREVPVRLLYGAPGALHPRARTVRVRLREVGIPAIVPPRGVRATRVAGDRVRVTWTAHGSAANNIGYVVTGSATRGGEPLAIAAAFAQKGRSYAATLHHVRGIRFVAVRTFDLGADPFGPAVEVRVR